MQIALVLVAIISYHYLLPWRGADCQCESVPHQFLATTVHWDPAWHGFQRIRLRTLRFDRRVALATPEPSAHSPFRPARTTEAARKPRSIRYFSPSSVFDSPRWRASRRCPKNTALSRSASSQKNGVSPRNHWHHLFLT